MDFLQLYKRPTCHGAAATSSKHRTNPKFRYGELAKPNVLVFVNS